MAAAATGSFVGFRRCGVRAGLALAAGLAFSSTPRADALRAVQVLRAGGCGGILPVASPLYHSAGLDRTAAQWAAGTPLTGAAGPHGYRGSHTAGVHVSAAEAQLLQVLRRDCGTLADQNMQEIGAYRRGPDNWIVLASAAIPPVRAPATAVAAAPVLPARALQLVNEVRARGTYCGARQFAPAAPLRLSETLAGVALGHANDMAVHNYFEHEDRSGHTPAQRVRATGYRETLVGENIAYGPESVEEVVRGWLGSSGHCENIMDPRFAEMGIADAPGRTSRHGLYWVQLLAAPRA